MKALWLDEEPESLTYEIRLLTARGWSVDLSNHVEEAKTRIASATYDVLICDLILPRNSFDCTTCFVDIDAGIEFIDHVRNPSRPGQTSATVPIIVCTARLAAGAALSKFESPSAVLFLLTKPIPQDDFTRAAALVEQTGPSATRPRQP
ncbi:MAG TPA: response regulator [Verrucomicrobiota bacterium]|nr:response regulator [Verrucomicrobiota bacterium]